MSNFETAKIGQNDTSIEYSIKVSAEITKSIHEEKIEQIKGKVKIDGFRPGKTPDSIIIKRYSNSVLQEIFEEQINTAVTELYKENKDKKIVGSPEVKIINNSIDNGLEATISIYFIPHFEINYNNITIERQIENTSKEELEKQKLLLLQQFAKKNEIFDTEYQTKKGDELVIDFTGKINDIEFAGGSSKNHNIVIGSNSFIDTFEDQLCGKKLGQDIEVKVTFPKDYQQKELSGVDAKFDVKINKIFEISNPEFSEEIAKECNFVDLADLEYQITKSLDTVKNQQNNKTFLEKAIKEIVNLTNFSLPENLVREYSKDFKKEDEDDYKNKLQELELAIKTEIILSKITEEEEIKIANDDIFNEFKHSFPIGFFNNKNNKVNKEDILKYITANENLQNSLVNSIKNRKITDFIATKINVKTINN
jgi:trigger factor